MRMKNLDKVWIKTGFTCFHQYCLNCMFKLCSFSITIAYSYFPSEFKSMVSWISLLQLLHLYIQMLEFQDITIFFFFQFFRTCGSFNGCYPPYYQLKYFCRHFQLIYGLALSVVGLSVVVILDGSVLVFLACQG